MHFRVKLVSIDLMLRLRKVLRRWLRPPVVMNLYLHYAAF